MSYDIKLTLRAQRDLEDIIEYTHRTWGSDQVERYVPELGRTIGELSERPSRQGKSLDELKPGLRYVQHKEHYFVFFRVEGQTVEVLRLLHQARDWRRILGTE